MRTLHTSGRNPAARTQTGLVCALLITLALFVPLQNPFIASATSAPEESTVGLDTAGAASPQGTQLTACGLLNAFINECQAQSDKTLTTAQATQLITAASQIKTAIGCQ